MPLSLVGKYDRHYCRFLQFKLNKKLKLYLIQGYTMTEILNDMQQNNLANVSSFEGSAVLVSTASNLVEEDYSSAIRILGICIGIFDIIVGSLGNAFTILAIATNKKLHKPFHIFIANLGVIDFLTASFMMPFNVASYSKQVCKSRLIR